MEGCPDRLIDMERAALSARLTARQLECLRLAAEGLGSPEIGRRLSLSARTVDDHLAAACRTLGVRTRIQAVAVAVALGLIHPTKL